MSVCCFSVTLDNRSSSFAFSALLVLIGGGFGDTFDTAGVGSVVFEAVVVEVRADDGPGSV